MKQFFSVMLAMALVLGLAVPAMAATSGPTVAVTPAGAASPKTIIIENIPANATRVEVKLTLSDGAGICSFAPSSSLDTSKCKVWFLQRGSTVTITIEALDGFTLADAVTGGSSSSGSSGGGTGTGDSTGDGGSGDSNPSNPGSGGSGSGSGSSSGTGDSGTGDGGSGDSDPNNPGSGGSGSGDSGTGDGGAGDSGPSNPGSGTGDGGSSPSGDDKDKDTISIPIGDLSGEDDFTVEKADKITTETDDNEKTTQTNVPVEKPTGGNGSSGNDSGSGSGTDSGDKDNPSGNDNPGSGTGTGASSGNNPGNSGSGTGSGSGAGNGSSTGDTDDGAGTGTDDFSLDDPKTWGSWNGTMPFTDVTADDWFYIPVLYVYGRGLMKGTSRTTFSPALTTTRGMVVTILYRLEHSPAVSAGNPFPDVKSEQYYTDAVTWASANGIVKGYSDGLFGPDDTITREQMATILHRYAQYKGKDVTVAALDWSGYQDAGSISAYAVPAMEWAVQTGLIQGKGEGLLDPGGNASRAEAAALLQRFAEKIR